MAKSTELDQLNVATKGKRGRPKGSTNSSTKETKQKTGKRGRPKGSTNNTSKGKRGRKPKGYSVNPTFQTVNDNLLIKLPQAYKQIIFITSDKKQPEILFVDL